MKKRTQIILFLIMCAFSFSVNVVNATSMYCAANIVKADTINAKVHEVIKNTLLSQCKDTECQKKVDTFVMNLPGYPVSIDTKQMTFHDIPKVDHYHTSLCYEVEQGDVPACDKLFDNVDQPQLLESALRNDIKASTVKIKNLRHFFVEKTGEFWLVADIQPVAMSSGKYMQLHISLFSTTDKSFLDSVEKSLTSILPEERISLGDVSCRLGIQSGTSSGKSME